MTDYQEFDFKTASLDGVSLIEASAGTGKTFSLERIVARLIVENGIKIETMLLMTFTKAATAELSSRIRNLLIQLREAWDKRLSEEFAEFNPDIQELVECLQKNIAKHNSEHPAVPVTDDVVRFRLIEAVSSFDDASIFTIHSFCQKMLTEYVFSRGGGFGLTVGDDTELENQALDEFLREAYAKISKNPKDGYDVKKELLLWEKSWHEKLQQFKSQPSSVLNSVGVLELKKKDAYKPQPAMKRILADFCKRVPERIRQLKQQQKIMTYDDMLLELYQCISPDDQKLYRGDVVDGIRKRFRAVLVDEFQDTDAVQFNIFKTLFLDASVGNEALPEAVFFVGDPKQAIYGFRSAELETYFKAAELIDALNEEKGRKRLQLSKNYRSTPAIIHAVNTLFAKFSAKNKKYEDHHSFLHEKIKYTGVEPSPEKLPLLRKVNEGDGEKWRPVPAFELWTNKEDEQSERTHEKDIRPVLSAAIAEDIARLLKNKDVYYDGRLLEAKDIAILVKERPHADLLREELATRHIRTRLESNENVFQSTEAIEILTLLRAMATPDDSAVLTSARATRLVGHNLQSIQQDTKALSDFRHAIEDAADHILHQGIYPVFSRLMHDSFLTMDRLLQIANGERILTNYQHILEMMQVQQQKIGNDLASIIHWLTSAINGTASATDADESKLRLESDANVVNIVTIHASKGLEYPVVYLADALQTRIEGRRGRSVFKEYAADGSKSLKVTPSPISVSNHKQTYERDEQENIRLAYVAMTRAKSRLVLPLALGGTTVKNQPVIETGSIRSAYVRALFGTSENAAQQNERDWNVFFSRINQWMADLQHFEPIVMGALKEHEDLKEISLASNLKQEDFFCVRDWKILPTDVTELMSDENQEIEYCNAPASPIGRAWSRTSFSGISRDLAEVKGNAEKSGYLTFPRGTEAGDSLHKLIESIVNQGVDCSSEEEFNRFINNIDQTVEEWLDKAPFYRRLEKKTGKYEYQTAVLGDKLDKSDVSYQDYCMAWLKQRIQTLLNVTLPHNVNLRKVIQTRKVVAELKFLLSTPGDNDDFTVEKIVSILPSLEMSVKNDRHHVLKSLKGYLAGEIDLLFKHENKYWVIDWKSNAIETEKKSADNPANYTQTNIKAVMKEHHYKLQALCYLVALYRYLHQMHPDYSNEQVMEQIGGAMYVFLRGVGEQKEMMPDGTKKQIGVLVMPIDEMEDMLRSLDGLLG